MENNTYQTEPVPSRSSVGISKCTIVGIFLSSIVYIWGGFFIKKRNPTNRSSGFSFRHQVTVWRSSCSPKNYTTKIGWCENTIVHPRAKMAGVHYLFVIFSIKLPSRCCRDFLREMGDVATKLRYVAKEDGERQRSDVWGLKLDVRVDNHEPQTMNYLEDRTNGWMDGRQNAAHFGISLFFLLILNSGNDTVQLTIHLF